MRRRKRLEKASFKTHPCCCVLTTCSDVLVAESEPNLPSARAATDTLPPNQMSSVALKELGSPQGVPDYIPPGDVLDPPPGSPGALGEPLPWAKRGCPGQTEGVSNGLVEETLGRNSRGGERSPSW